MAIPYRRSTLMLLLAVFAVLWFGNLDYRRLVRPDEGRYAEIPREMAVTGDWITPRLNGIKYFEKPPLQYWATAAAYKVFGEHEWTVRLWPALTGFAGVLLVAFAGARLFGAVAGLYAALVLASSAGYMLIAHIATLDMGLTFFMTLTLCGFLLGLREETPPRERRGWMYAAWAGMALAVLSKGLIGVVLPGLALGAYMLIQRDFGVLRRLRLASGGALFLVLTAPWFIAVSLINPGFFEFFFIHEHFARFLTKTHHRPGPWWYFVPILLVGILPWLTVLCDALPRMWRANAPGAFQPQRLLLLWAGLIFAFFSVSSSKLPSYILPIFPALALLIGLRLSGMSPRTLGRHLVFVAVLSAAILAGAPYAVRFASAQVPLALYQHYVPWIAAAGAAGLIGAAGAIYCCRRGMVAAALIVATFATLVSEQLVTMGHNSLAPASSAYHIAQRIKPYLRPGMPFYSVGTYEQTLPFYIKRTVTLVAFQDEMAYGLAHEPALWLPTYADFTRAWREQDYALAIMTPQTYAGLEQTGLPMQVIARDTRRVVVKTMDKKPPAPVTPPASRP